MNQPHHILSAESAPFVIAAVHYAIRRITMNGVDLAFDPEVLAGYVAHALCGSPVDKGSNTDGSTGKFLIDVDRWV